MVGRHNLGNDIPNGNVSHHAQNGDAQPWPHIFGFKDTANKALDDERRDELKRKLIEGVDRGSLEKYRKSKDETKSIKNKKIRNFYETQNERLNDWSKPCCLRTNANPAGKARATLGRPSTRRRLLLFFTLPDRLAGGFRTRPALHVDRLDDEQTWRWRLRALQGRFPVGRRRLEPLGILVFSVLMIVSFLQILQESVQKLLPSGDHTAATLPNVAIFAIVRTIVVKGIIGLGYVRVKTTQVQALAQDCKTDVYFNTLSLLFPLIGRKLNVWWLDPLGAALLSLYVIYDWSTTCFENVTRLSGSAVDDRLQKKLTFLAYRFSPIVDGFKSLNAYHAGDGVWAEVDVLLDGNEKLARAHDIAETLQYCLEGLQDVDRAFVTVDYTSQGPTGHASGNS